MAFLKTVQLQYLTKVFEKIQFRPMDVVMFYCQHFHLLLSTAIIFIQDRFHCVLVQFTNRGVTV